MEYTLFWDWFDGFESSSYSEDIIASNPEEAKQIAVDLIAKHDLGPYCDRAWISPKVSIHPIDDESIAQAIESFSKKK